MGLGRPAIQGLIIPGRISGPHQTGVGEIGIRQGEADAGCWRRLSSSRNSKGWHEVYVRAANSTLKMKFVLGVSSRCPQDPRIPVFPPLRFVASNARTLWNDSQTVIPFQLKRRDYLLSKWFSPFLFPIDEPLYAINLCSFEYSIWQCFEAPSTEPGV